MNCYISVRQEICNDIVSISFEYNNSQSIILGPGVNKVIIFTESSFKGISYEYSTSNGNLRQNKDLYGKVKSIKIIK